jgi:hypothetical protein
MMATSNNPLAPNPVTDIDGPDVFPPIEPQEDLGEPVPVGEEGNVETDLGSGSPGNRDV